MTISHFLGPDEHPPSPQIPGSGQILQQPKDVGSMILPISQMGKLRLHNGKRNFQGHPAQRGKSRNLNEGLVSSRAE